MKITLKPGEFVTLSNQERNEIVIEVPDGLEVKMGDTPPQKSDHDARVDRTRDTILQLLRD